MESKERSEHLIFILIAACLLLMGLWWLSSGRAWGQALPLSASLTSLSAEPDWWATGELKGGQFAYSVASAGDFNGDGYADILVGAPKEELDAYRGGTVHAYYGYAGGVQDNPAWVLGSEQQGSAFGASLASADLDGDSLDEILVGAPEYATTTRSSGKVFVYGHSQLNDTPSLIWEKESPIAEARYGQSISSGDFNNDGYADLLIGAPQYTNSLNNQGAVFIHYGSPVGLADEPDWSYESDQAGSLLGSSVAGVGDVNGDGYNDILVGAPGYNNGVLVDAGRIYLFLGSDSGLSDTPAWTYTGTQANSKLGARVSAAGDVNHDGHADVLANVRYMTGEFTFYGQALAFYGSASGLGASPSWSFTIEQQNTCFGCALATVGDVNGDHIDDIIIGDWTYNFLYDSDGQNSIEGAAFIFLGKPSGLSGNIAWLAYGKKAEASFGYAVASAGDVNGDGFSDVLIGGPDYKTDRDPVGRADLYLGSEAEAVVYRFQVMLPMVTSR
jgi:hypothetical protein